MTKTEFEQIQFLLKSKKEITEKQRTFLDNITNPKEICISTSKTFFYLTRNEYKQLLKCFEEELILIDSALEKLGYVHNE